MNDTVLLKNSSRIQHVNVGSAINNKIFTKFLLNDHQKKKLIEINKKKMKKCRYSSILFSRVYDCERTPSY